VALNGLVLISCAMDLQTLDFTAANAATIQPLMNIDAAWCTAFLTRIGVPGGTTPTLTCAKQLIYFVRGWDVLNQERACQRAEGPSGLGALGPYLGEGEDPMACS